MKITRVEIRDVKAIKYVCVSPRPGTNVVGGNNCQGKTSFLDCFAFALGGKKLIPEDPIRDGGDHAEIRLQLTGDPATLTPPLEIIRVFDRDKQGKVHSELFVRDASGGEEDLAGTPQGILDDRLGRVKVKNRPIGFDPSWFQQQKPAEQASILRGLIEFDFEKYEVDRGVLYEKRRVVGVEGKAKKGVLDGLPLDDEVAELGNNPIDIEALQQEIVRIRGVNADRTAARQQLTDAEVNMRSDSNSASRAKDAVDRLKDELKQAQQKHKQAVEKHVASEKTRDKLAKELGDIEIVDTEEISASIIEANRHNQAVEANNRHEAVQKECDDLRKQYGAKTKEIEALDASRDAAMDSADLGVEGLTFGEDGVLYRGRPLQEASSAEAINVSVAVGCALNPALNLMLVRNASLMDGERIQELIATVTAKDAQCFLEIVGDTDDCDLRMLEGEADFIHPDIHPDIQIEEPQHA